MKYLLDDLLGWMLYINIVAKEQGRKSLNPGWYIEIAVTESCVL